MVDEKTHPNHVTISEHVEALVKPLAQALLSCAPGLRIRAASAGDRVRATIPEITMEMAMVIANCL